jgi:hypothetical protein
MHVYQFPLFVLGERIYEKEMRHGANIQMIGLLGDLPIG